MIAAPQRAIKTRPPTTPPTIAPIEGPPSWWLDELSSSSSSSEEEDDPEAELESELEFELKPEDGLVIEAVGYPGGYCIPVETPFDPV